MFLHFEFDRPHIVRSAKFANCRVLRVLSKEHPLVTGLITGVPFHHVYVPISCSDRNMYVYNPLKLIVNRQNIKVTII
jgi:hypothetical protein